MDDAEAIRVVNRARSRQRWDKVRAAQAAGESPVLQGAPVQVVVQRHAHVAGIRPAGVP
jgi:hypothetical protein